MWSRSRLVVVLVAAGGALTVRAAAPAGDGPVPGRAPWPLTRSELEAFAAGGLTAVRIDRIPDQHDPAGGHWPAEFRRPAPDPPR